MPEHTMSNCIYFYKNPHQTIHIPQPIGGSGNIIDACIAEPVTGKSDKHTAQTYSNPNFPQSLILHRPNLSHSHRLFASVTSFSFTQLIYLLCLQSKFEEKKKKKKERSEHKERIIHVCETTLAREQKKEATESSSVKAGLSRPSQAQTQRQ